MTIHQVWYETLLQQVASECYLDGVKLVPTNPQERDLLLERLVLGNNDLRRDVLVNGAPTLNLRNDQYPGGAAEDILPGASRLTPAQAEYFLDNWDIVRHHANDPSGFSATLFRNRGSNEYTLSFRSTEYFEQKFGGDKERDYYGADREIFFHGFALAQLSAMEAFYRGLKADPEALKDVATFNVTGYSLGGHLATVFTELHPDAVSHAYLFNAAGRGSLRGGAIQSIAQLIDTYDALVRDPGAAERLGVVEYTGEGGGFSVPSSILNAPDIAEDPRKNAYLNPRHQWALQVLSPYLAGTFVEGVLPPNAGGIPAIDDKVTYLMGMGGHGDSTVVANSGITPKPLAQKTLVFIEDQPDRYSGSAGSSEPTELPPLPESPSNSTAEQDGDFGRTHSIALLADSLALISLFREIDPNLSQLDVETIIAAASNQRASALGAAFDEAFSDSDSLERALQSLARLLDPGAVRLPIDTTPNGFAHLGNRETFYAQIESLRTNWAGKDLQIVPLASMAWIEDSSPLYRATTIRKFTTEPGAVNAAALLEHALKDNVVGAAYRYALQNLNGFVVLGDGIAYDDPKLRLQTASDGPGLTREYLESRAQMAVALFDRNVGDRGYAHAESTSTLYRDQALASEVAAISGSPNWLTSIKATALALSNSQRDAAYADQLRKDALDGTARIVAYGNGQSSLAGGRGDDALFGSEANETLLGGEGRDYLEGGPGADTLIGGPGNDRLAGGAGVDTYAYSSGDGFDEIRDADGQGLIVYNARTLTGGQQVGNGFFVDAAGTRYSRIDAGAGGTDLLIDDVLLVRGFSSGDLGIVLQPGAASVAPSAGDPVFVYEASELPRGAATSSLHLGPVLNLSGSNSDDLATGVETSFYARSGNDSIALSGSSSFVTVDAGAGDDTVDATAVQGGVFRRIAGGAGSDHLVGSSGSDLLLGDNYTLLAGDGPASLTIDGFTANLAELSSRFTPVSSEDFDPGFWTQSGAYLPFISLVHAEASGGDLDPTHARQTILLENWVFPGGLPQILDYVVGGAGQSFDDTIDAGAGSDIADGGSGSDVILGGDGDDFLGGDYDYVGLDSLSYARLQDSFGALAVRFGLPGNDVLDGGEGNDRLVDRNGGNDTLLGGPGDDEIVSAELYANDEEPAYNYIDAGPGNDRIDVQARPNDVNLVFGGDGDDSLTSSGGRFTLLDGGEGNDTYRVSNGMIRDSGGDDSLDVSRFPLLLSPLLLFGENTPQPSLVVPLPTEDPEVSADLGQPPSPPSFQARQSVIVRRTGKDLELLYDADQPAPPEAPPPAEGVPPGGVPPSPAPLGERASHIVFSDWFSDPANRIERIGSLTADAFERWGSLHTGTADAEHFSGTEFTDRILAGAGDDVVSTGAGDDLIVGGAGDDILDGGDGDDVYWYAAYDGNDVILDSGGIDTLRFDATITRTDIAVTLGNASVKLNTGSGSVDIPFALSAEGEPVIERLEFADGTLVALRDLASAATDVVGTGGNDLLIGNEAANLIVAGPGNDLLRGGGGSDTYLFAIGDGIDRLSDLPREGEINTVLFGPGITPESISLGKGSLVLRIGSGGDELHLEGVDTQDIFGPHDVDRFVFDDGTELSYAQLVSRGLDLSGTPAGDLLIGASTGDRIVGGNGDDLLFGLEGDDHLDGGPGSDRLYGGPGSDTYRFGIGSGNDFIDDSAGGVGDLDVALLGEGIEQSNTSIAYQDDSLVLRPVGSGDSLSIRWNAALGVGVGEVRFVDGTVWNRAFLQSVVASAWNRAPTVSATLEDVAVLEDEAFVHVIGDNAFHDPDAGDALSYSASLSDGSQLPAWLRFDASTRTFSGTPENADVGNYNIRVIATDTEGLAAFDDFGLRVLNVNDEPSVVTPLENRAVTVGTVLALAVPAATFHDPDPDDTLTLHADLASGDPLPAWLVFDGSSATFNGVPQAVGMYPLRVQATDAAGASASALFSLLVEAVPGSNVVGTKTGDVLLGSGGDETLRGRGGDDLLIGGAGDDLLRGGTGDDVLQGGAGDDVLRAGKGQNLLDGGAGNDTLYGGRDTSILAGGAGDDVIRAGKGADVILFNRGDGNDTVFADGAGDNTLSLGGIRLSDLSLRKQGKHLVLDLGGGESITFRGWYGGRTSLANLQIVTDSSTDYDPESLDPLLNRRVASFDFLGLVSAFDAARSAQPGLSDWALSDALLQFHIAGADDEALGGDLAYQYASRGSFEGISLSAAQDSLRAGNLGTEALALRPLNGLNEGLVQLAA